MSKKVVVVGLGAGDAQGLTLDVWETIRAADRLYLRTADHPVVPWLERKGVTFTSFDHVYEEFDSFPPVYEAIVERLLAEAEQGPIVYAVPGHPSVAEQTTQMLTRQGNTRGISVDVQGGRSFLEVVFTRLGVDPIDGLLVLDGFDVQPSQLNPRVYTVIGQVYDQMTASDVKLTLMERYPDDWRIVVAHALGVDGMEDIRHVPLYEMDHDFPVSSLSLVAVPPIPRDVALTREFTDFIDIISTLRGPNGCPWDRKQSHESLRKYLVEETAEFIEAVNDGDFDHMCEELGDVLLQVALHAEIAAERGDFNMYDVIKGISEKMIRRHPHVFGNANVDDADDVSKNWEAIKAAEKRANGEKTEAVALSDLIPPTFPTLSQAFVLQKEAGKAGFDWENIEPVVGKVKEELNECLHADRDEVELELGDLLFSVVNLSRFLRVDPEQALRRACHKFTKRFAHMRQAAGAQWDGMTLDEMEPLWQKAKQKDTH